MFKLRRYAVTVGNNWATTREFWTYEGACARARELGFSAWIFKWRRGQWEKLL